MKKALIGLLIVAAGVITYFLLQDKNKTPGARVSQQEMIIGKWKLDSIQIPSSSKDHFMVGIMGMVDSNLLNYEYEFKNNGAVSTTLRDSLIQDSARYEWNNKGQLVWKEYPSDSTGETFNVLFPQHDSLVLQSQDSAALLFSKQVK